MQKILSIIAVIAGALYLAVGISLLVFQDTIKAVFIGYGVETVHVYPIQYVLALAVMGIPCVALGIMSMSDSPENGKGMNMLLVVYSSVMLVLGEILLTVGSTINSIIVSRTKGAAGLANMSAVCAAFGHIQFLITLSLVLLLLRGAFGLGESGQRQYS